MANLFTLMGTILIDNSKADESIAKSTDKAEKFAKKLLNGAEKAAKWSAAIGAAAFGVGVALSKHAVGNAIDFEKEMSNVGTLISGDSKSVKNRMKELGNEVLGMSKDLKLSTDLLTDGLYQTISALGDSADSMDILGTAAKGAKAGNATVTDSVNLLSAVMKGYNDVSAEAAQKASDLAFNTVKLGQTSFPELASSMGKVIPLANNMKVSQEELFTVYATLTGVTGSASEVTTQLRGALAGLMSPTKDMQKQMKELGYSSGDAMVQELGLEGSLLKLKESVGGNELALAKLFSSTEAQTAVMALAGSQADMFKDKLGQMEDASGATDEAFSRQTDNLGSRIDSIKNKFEVLSTEVGQRFLPHLDNVARFIDEHFPAIEETVLGVLDKAEDGVKKLKQAEEDLKNKFEEAKNWVDQNKTALELLGVALGTITALVVAYNAATIAHTIASGAETIAIYAMIGADAVYSAATGAATIATTAFGAAITFLTSPIAIVIIAIGALVAAGILLYKNWDTVKQKAIDFGKGLLNEFNKIKTGISDYIDGVKKKAVDGFNDIKSKVTDNINGMAEGISDGIEKARKFFSDGIEKIKKLTDFKFSMPKIPTPHFSISPSGWKIGDLLKGSIPSLGVKWYREAMDDGRILNRKEIFGFNPRTGKFLAGGEAGSETVIGTESLMSKIRRAVSEKDGRLADILLLILDVLVEIRDDMPESFYAAVKSLKLSIGKREFARLVDEVS